MSISPAEHQTNVSSEKTQTTIDQATKIELLKQLRAVQEQLKKCACKRGR